MAGLRLAPMLHRLPLARGLHLLVYGVALGWKAELLEVTFPEEPFPKDEYRERVAMIFKLDAQ